VLLIDPNHLDSNAYVAVIVDGVELARRIVQAPPLHSYRGAEVMPGTDIQSDDEIASFARRTAESLCHPIGTCTIGETVTAAFNQPEKHHQKRKHR
jgi:choline dehydrogenase